MIKLATPVPIFLDLDGNPITDGDVFIGVAGQNPETNPMSIYWDELMTVPAAQPIKLMGGYPARYGAPANLYINGYDYSITVRDKKGRLVYSLLHTAGLFINSQTVVFANDTFGAVPDGVADNTAAFTNFLTYMSTVGGVGYMPPGTYKISNVDVDLTGGKSFAIYGAGRTSTIITSSTPGVNVLTLRNPTGVTLRDFALTPGYVGTDMSTGAGIVLVNANYTTLRSLAISQFSRVGIMSYGDHQDTIQYNPAKTYTGLSFDDIYIDGASAYSFGVGPSAFIIADANNSRITNSYIKNIGLYGYEFKNDCNNCITDNCVSEDTYYPHYFGGDGYGWSYGYVKNSGVSNCIVRRGGAPIFIGNARNNTFENIIIDQTNYAQAQPTALVQFRTGSINNRATNITVIARGCSLFDIRSGVVPAGKDTTPGSVPPCVGNMMEFANVIDGAYSGRAGFFGDSACVNNTIDVKNRDSTQPLWLESTAFYANTVIDRKYNWTSYNIGAKALIKHRLGDVGADTMFSTSKGIAYVGDTFDEFTITNQIYAYKYIGNFTKPDVYTFRYQLDTGTKRETLYATTGALTQTYVTDQLGFYPSSDNTQRLGGGAGFSRWSVVYAGTGTINTSDAREKQQIRPLEDAEKAVAVRLKSLVRAFRFNDAVAAKGDGARIHIGVIAQEVKAAFEAEGLVAEDYAILCYDEWDEQPEVVETFPDEFDEHGELVRPAGRRVLEEYRAAGNRYGVRYEELLAFIISAI